MARPNRSGPRDGDARVRARDAISSAPARRSALRRSTVSVVIPTYNEARNVAWVLRRLPPVEEVILVDGRSKDGTVEVARSVRPDIRVVLERRPGKGAALRAGFAAASSDIVVMIDADGSMDPAEIAGFTRHLEDGHEFVKGSRFLPGGGTTDMTALRMLGNWGLMTLANVLFMRRFSDLCYGYCAFRREALGRLQLDADGFEIETQIVLRAARAGLRTKEVPSFESPRMFGESNLQTFRDGWRVLTTILRERLGGSVLAPADRRPSVPARSGPGAGLPARRVLPDGAARGAAPGDGSTGGEWAVQLLGSRQAAAGRAAWELRYHPPLAHAKAVREHAFESRAFEAGSDED